MSVFPPDTRSIFQLTPSRRATQLSGIIFTSPEFQLTPSRRATSAPPVATIIIETFQLTPSRRATLAPIGARSGLYISTHALTEGDKIPMNAEPSSEHFNSRPHGGRRSSHWSSRSRKRISTHALTEGDYRRSQSHISVSISTHALTEGDSSASS